uniref:Uncharacterized protein n=1 Tax=Romanomermis culicivorax TaxID=13658 RepID=A0A915IX39_ROMCU
MFRKACNRVNYVPDLSQIKGKCKVRECNANEEFLSAKQQIFIELVAKPIGKQQAASTFKNSATKSSNFLCRE